MDLYTTVYAAVRNHVATWQDDQHWIPPQTQVKIPYNYYLPESPHC
jgi:hypothetical protein